MDVTIPRVAGTSPDQRAELEPTSAVPDGDPTDWGAALRLAGLRKAFGDQVVVPNLTLSLQPGEFFTLLGPSQVGKSVIVQLIAGFLAPTRGEIYLDERPLGATPPHRRHVGLILSDYALFPHLTAFENVAFPLRLRRVPSRQIGRRVAETLALVDGLEYATQHPATLTPEQQFLVALARAVVFNPRLVLLDEPFASLAPDTRDDARRVLKLLHQRLRPTVLCVTRDRDTAMTLSDRLGVLWDGALEQVGSPLELYEEPCNLFVDQMLGDTNLLRGWVRDPGQGDLTVLVHPSGQTFRALPHGLLRRGAAMVAAVRPERLVVDYRSELVAERNCLRGQVIDVTYLGDRTVYQVLVGPDRLTVKEQNRNRGRRAAIGDQVDVIWDPAYTRLLEDPEEVVGDHPRGGGLDEVAKRPIAPGGRDARS
jgi:putative spermidine/putrescine transport system ATP-binding protein